MEDFSLQELPTYWIAAGVVAAILILWIAAGWLWNNRYRPIMVKKGKPTPAFNNALQRIFRFLLKEDTQPPKKAKNALVRKLVNWRNTYLLLIAASIALPLTLGYSPLAPLVLLFLIAFTRVRKVFRERNAILHRMFEVANSEFRYKKEASLNPWAYVNIQKWENLTTPGKTIVTFPPAFRVDSPMKRQEFQQHFDGTVAEENVWSYEWSGAKGIVECAPVPHLPTMAPYPGSADRPWDQIPLGLGIDGEVVWNLSSEPHFLICGSTGGGKSVLQRNIIFHTIQHSDKIKFLGVDLKRVELDPYAKYEDTVLGIAKTLEDGVEVMRYARDAMMERYEIMEQMGVNHFMAMNNPPPALLVMVDEAYMFMAPSGGKTDEQKEQDQLHGEATVIIGDIARLGRAAGVHLVLATQRPDAKVIYGEIKANLGARYMAGRSGSTPSLMVLDSDTGTRIPDIKGRGVVSFNGDEEFIQGYFAEQDWIDGWLARKNNQEDTANEELLQIEAGSASSADEPMDDEDIQPDENGVYPKKKKAKKKRNSRKKFRGLKPVPDFDDGELSYGEASEVPKEVLKRTSKKARGKSGEEIDPREFDMDSELNSSDFEDSESFTQPTPQPAPSFVGHLDEEAEGNENDEMDRFIPTPVATPALSIEDEEEDEGFADPFASRPKLTGASSIKKDNDLVWDDDLDSVFEDVSHNIPMEQAKSPKKELPARPVLPTTASKKVAETPAGTPAWQEEQSVPQSPAQKSREVRSAAPEPGSNNPAPAPRKPARRAPSAPEAPAARVAPMPAPPARMPTPPPGAGRLPSAPKTSGLPTIPNAPKPPNASGSTPTPTTLPKLPKLPPSP